MAEAFNVHAVGKRKSAVARVYLRPGNGRIVVNQRDFQEYFPVETTRNLARQPLALVNVGPELDILVNVQGGGPEGQAGAIKHGLSRGSGGPEPGVPAHPQESRPPDPGSPHQGTQEVRPPGRPPGLPVLQALEPPP